MMRNTPKVLDFKVNLVDAFFKARDCVLIHNIPITQIHNMLIVIFNSEKAKASGHGSGLSNWKKKRDSLTSMINRVENVMQPSLFDVQEVHSMIIK